MKSYKRKTIMGKLIVHILLIIGMFLTVIPFLWMILTAFKTLNESMAVPPKIFPDQWNFDNFRAAFNALPYKKLYFNTILFTFLVTIGQLVFSTLGGYVFARIDFKGREYLFLIVLSILMVPGQIFIIPWFQLITKLKLGNTITALVLPNLFSAFATFLMRQYFLGIPKQLEEAAIIDGANHFQIFYRIMLPLVKPGLISLVITTSLFAWNNLMWPLIVNTSSDKMTLSAGLASMQDLHITNYPMLMAGALLAIWPMIIAFMLFQKQFTQGLADSGGK